MIYWIWLTKIPGIGTVMQKELLRVFKTPESVFNASSEKLLKCTGLGKGKLRLKKFPTHQFFYIIRDILEKKVWALLLLVLEDAVVMVKE